MNSNILTTYQQNIYNQVLTHISSLPIGRVFCLDTEFYSQANISGISTGTKIIIGRHFSNEVNLNNIPNVKKHMFRNCNYCGNKKSNNKSYYEKI